MCARLGGLCPLWRERFSQLQRPHALPRALGFWLRGAARAAWRRCTVMLLCMASTAIPNPGTPSTAQATPGAAPGGQQQRRTPPALLPGHKEESVSELACTNQTSQQTAAEIPRPPFSRRDRLSLKQVCMRCTSRNVHSHRPPPSQCVTPHLRAPHLPAPAATGGFRDRRVQHP